MAVASALSAGGGAGALSVAKSYPTSEVTGSDLQCQSVTAQEWRRKQPHVWGQGRRPRWVTPHPIQGRWLGGDTPCPRPGAVAGRSHPASEVRGGWEELPHFRGQGRQPGGATLVPRSGAVAGRSYPASEVSGGQEEIPCVRGQGRWPWGATPSPRPRAAAGRSHPHPRPGPAAGRSNRRSSGCAGTGGPRGAIPRWRSNNQRTLENHRWMSKRDEV